MRGLSLLYLILLSLSACGSEPDHRAVDAPPFIPADHPPPLQFKNLGGPILAHPSLVTVTWPADPLAGFVQTFDAWLATSQYLADGLAEYGISSAQHAGSFVFADAAPASIDATEIGQKLADEAAAGRLLPPTADRLYVVYTPPGTTVLRLGFKSCETFAGTHLSKAATGAGSPIVFALIPRCHNEFYSDQDNLTISASHEVTESITDPIFEMPAWFTEDPTSTGAEIADACIGNSLVGDVPYRVNQLYSNAAAKAGLRPCLPSAPGPMCGVWTANPKLMLARGATADISLNVYYTAPTALKSSVLNFFSGPTAKLSPTSFVLVQNGDVVPAKITVPADAPVGYFDFVTMGLWCGDSAYTSWYYVHAQDPALMTARRATLGCLLPLPSRP